MSSAISDICGPCMPRMEVSSTSRFSEGCRVTPSVPVVKACIHLRRTALRTSSSSKTRKPPIAQITSTSAISSPTSGRVATVRMSIEGNAACSPFR